MCHFQVFICYNTCVKWNILLKLHDVGYLTSHKLGNVINIQIALLTLLDVACGQKI